jgi:hypothetical protein
LLIDEDGSVERVELTEPFAALLGDGRVVQARREIDASDVAPDVPDGPGATNAFQMDIGITDRARPFGVLAATFGEMIAVTPRIQHAPWRHANGARCER